MRRLVPLLLTVLLVTACSGTDDAGPPADPGAASSSGSPDSSASAPASPTAPSTSDAAPHPVSLAALAETDFNGGALRLGEVVLEAPGHTQYAVSYRSGDLRVSGRLAVPDGRGPFPTVVLAHGYIDPAIYVNGQGMTREREWLGERGYVALHVDYRGHAESGPDRSGGLDMRMGYTEDVINAVLALRAWDGPVDDERVALVGRSMGGGIVYNALVAQPGLVDAGVAFAPVSSDAVDNFERWIRPDAARSDVATRILRRYGEPAEEPAFWAGISARSQFDRLSEPVLILHGSADDTCPLRWSRETAAAMGRAGADVTLQVYEGEGHAFGPQFDASMRRTAAFLERHLA